MTEADAAVAIVRTRGPRDSILLMRRAEREGDSWSGHWSFPGGRCETADGSPLHAALRELEEECGIRLTAECLESALPLSTARRRAGRYLSVAPFVFRVDGELPTVLHPAEAVEALWIPLAVLRDPSRHRLLPVPWRGSEMLFPGIALPGAPLWGFTYRLITSWLALGPTDARAGFEAASAVLDFLVEKGAALRSGWSDRRAVVEGQIPVDAIVAHFSEPQHFLPAINCLEARHDAIRIAGPEFEDYWIVTS